MKLHISVIKKFTDYTCLAEISADSALKQDENYYPQAFLKECKETEEEKKND